VARAYHPGWRGWFTWGGYRGRLSYLGGSILVGLALGAVVTVLAGAAGLGADPAPLAATIPAVAGIAAAAIAGVVAWVCILAQRMRDIGMPVVPCLIGYGLASAVASVGVATWGEPGSAALWSADFPLWLNLLQIALTAFALALVILPGNAWLDED
jgi:hypothetical protein